ncbi:MAG: gamma-glutamylcyclotransferase [Rhodobacteraceae bacterium]|nr:gamma-glutamylcyclotransferase [Paracoccaceae bacterium]MCY4136843.1 gamma-glutamylcyclotransferase [Paracoccaceae bacterium]
MRPDEQDEDLWVFGYGSLIWQPGFEFVESVPGTLHGFARSFCMWSVHYRGSRRSPGLVLALKPQPGSFCRGLAFRVEASHGDAVLEVLRDRELMASAYREEWQTVELEDERRVSAVCYVVDTGHELYSGELSIEEQADIIGRSFGERGHNREYLFRTCERLESLGIVDSDLVELAGAVARPDR